MSNSKIAEVTTPPIIGAAMRFITSAPDWVVGDHMIGNETEQDGADRHDLGADALHRALDDGGVQVGLERMRAGGGEFVPGVVEVEEHDDAGLRVQGRPGQ